MSMLPQFLVHSNWFEGQGVAPSNMMDSERAHVQNLLHAVALLAGADAGFSGGTFRGHLVATETATNTLSVSPGVAFLRVPSSDGSDPFFDGGVDVAVVSEASEVTLKTPGTYPRVDLVAVLSEETSDTLSTEAIRSGDEVSDDDRNVRRVKEAAFQVVDGTGGSFAVPATPSGATPVAYYLHQDATTKVLMNGRKVVSLETPYHLSGSTPCRDPDYTGSVEDVEAFRVFASGSSMQILVASGHVLDQGRRWGVQPKAFTIPAPDATHPRRDVITVEDGQLVYTEGVPAAVPSPPDVGGVWLWIFTVPPGTISGATVTFEKWARAGLHGPVTGEDLAPAVVYEGGLGLQGHLGVSGTFLFAGGLGAFRDLSLQSSDVEWQIHNGTQLLFHEGSYIQLEDDVGMDVWGTSVVAFSAGGTLRVDRTGVLDVHHDAFRLSGLVRVQPVHLGQVFPSAAAGDDPEWRGYSLAAGRLEFGKAPPILGVGSPSNVDSDFLIPLTIPPSCTLSSVTVEGSAGTGSLTISLVNHLGVTVDSDSPSGSFTRVLDAAGASTASATFYLRVQASSTADYHTITSVRPAWSRTTAY